MRTLAVTSPLTEGAEVTAAQRRLNGHNFLNADYLIDTTVDGAFGPATGRACIRAKHWLGYPSAELLPIYGDTLDKYLSGAVPLPPEHKRRRTLRQKAVAQRPLRAKALDQARRYLGQKENPPGSNKIGFASDWYGLRGPWCAMAVTRWYVDAGSKLFKPGLVGVGGRHPGSGTYAYVPFIVSDARTGVYGLFVVGSPLPGDIVCYDWDGGVADHVGLFESWIPGGEGNEFKAIEGNTSVGNDSNGGEVMRRTRKRAQVEAFVRVGR